MARGFVRERIELVPLEALTVAQQVAALGDVPADVAGEIASRSDGNPFYVEAGRARPGLARLPPRLRDILLARLAVLDESTARLLAACAVIGDEADAE